MFPFTPPPRFLTHIPTTDAATAAEPHCATCTCAASTAAAWMETVQGIRARIASHGLDHVTETFTDFWDRTLGCEWREPVGTRMNLQLYIPPIFDAAFVRARMSKNPRVTQKGRIWDHAGLTSVHPIIQVRSRSDNRGEYSRVVLAHNVSATLHNCAPWHSALTGSHICCSGGREVAVAGIDDIREPLRSRPTA